MAMEDILIKYADRAFCYAVCAYLLWKDRVTSEAVKAALEAVRDAVERLSIAIQTLVASRKE